MRVERRGEVKRDASGEEGGGEGMVVLTKMVRKRQVGGEGE